ncbi:3-oxoacyl-[acyl-carrier-protein] synthase III C-terminal domain-containing protein [Clostridium saccharoperbutylacetonicum]|uniref:3-oxoacyl-[acyl-carrier-protein] synthase III C-terminal domain-containing protein n=1 Tax=Clostridium saccharoperbutylacetonicum TaxID=36745 RepID=UPI000983C3B6|nr:3-oxoacyl-[acyl-carrier-protein] synthase III C-terminal domain-containing protein [Clostridium saccharoperbutylacetonicum]AQR97336.1 3-oxoacyl-[acyl-carrier-protein] synthase 3 [Clostridium saccharoperbutylacetonicum]NSB33219.1 3-oxoacyl-[acyl-carrier-protein] synthase-3 [Clostridium saccharoperbutylacetonicum]
MRDIEVYHGRNAVNNDYYIEHFKKQGKDVKKFFEETLGRKYRYEINRESENALTMAIEVSHKVLKKSNYTGKDIDMIVYSGMLSEYVSPTSALIIHSAINGKKECFCHDMNVNCIGMTYALDLVNRYISTNPQINRVLLVGSDYLTPQVSPENEECYGQYGDVSCAVILERTEEDCKLIDTKVIVNNDFIDYVRFPKCGFAHIYDAPKEEMYVKWKSFGTWWIDGAIENINSILDNSKLSIEDISMFCFSQIAYKNIVTLREKIGISEEKSLYVGDTYGYTGTTSPFLVFYEGIKTGRIKRGNYVVFCTVAAGSTHITSLIKY